MISWLPIYLLTEKHFSKEQMSIAFLFFEWAAIPSTLLAGWDLYGADFRLFDRLLEK